MQNKTFRLFVSSTFSDFNEERKLLQTIVFPEIKKYCRDNGLNFQPIDLRWGVTEEASNDQKTLSLCLEEVQSSKYHPYPNFLIMAGDRYGWIPLPYAIEQNEYETILKNIDDLSDKELLNTWYKLDENQIPSSYILNERKKSDSSHDGVDYTNKDNWRKIENQLKTILQTSVKKSDLNEKQKRKYFTSATEAEVIEGIFKYLDKTEFQNKLLEKDATLENKDYENVFGYIRNIKSVDNENFKDRFLDKNSSKVNYFKNEIRKSIDESNILNINVNLITVSEDEKNGSLNYQYETILNNENSIFVKKMIEYLESSIDIYKQELKLNLITETEKDRQERFKNNKLKFFLEGSRKEALMAIDNYINNDNNQALVIYGKSGLGKSSLMAKGIDDSLLKYSDKKIIYRFVGSTVNLNSSTEVLISILEELGINEKINKVINPQTKEEENEKIEEFYSRIHDHLSNLSSDVIIFIDAVDQINNKDKFLWLPENLPNNIKIIISALKDESYKDDSKYFESLKSKTTNIYALEAFDNTKELINYLLFTYNRTISSCQLEYLEKKYKDVNTPLYLSVASQEIRHWKSNDETQTLASTQKDIIEKFILNLSKLYHHDKEFVKRVFTYIYLTNGVSESELLEIFSVDEEFINYLAPDTFHSNLTKELPVVIWARLYSQIKEFIKYELVNNQEVMSFFHREFKEVISQIEDIKSVHEDLVILIQKLIEKYQNEPTETNRWGQLYIKIIKNYHLKYEFDYLPKDNSKLKNWSEFFNQIKKEYYEEFIRYELIDQISSSFNEDKNSISLMKISFYYSKFLYESNQSEYMLYSSSLYYLSMLLIAVGKIKEALKLQLEALEINKKQKLNLQEGSTLELIATSYSRIGEINKAVECQREAVDIFRNHYYEGSETTQTYADSLIGLSDLLKTIENVSEAINHEREALEIYKNLCNNRPHDRGYKYKYVDILLDLSDSLIYFDKFDEAIEKQTESVEITKEFYEYSVENSMAYIKCLKELSYSLFLKGKVDKVIFYKKEALDVYKYLYYRDSLENLKEEYLKFLLDTARYLNSVGKANEATEYGKEAFEICKKYPLECKEHFIDCLATLSTSLHAIGKINEAIEYQIEVMQISSELYIKFPKLIKQIKIKCLINLGGLKALLNNFNEGIEFLNKAIEIYKDLNTEYQQEVISDYIVCLNLLAGSYFSDKRFEETVKYSKEYFSVLNINNLELDSIRKEFIYPILKYYQAEKHLNKNLLEIENYIDKCKKVFLNIYKDNFNNELIKLNNEFDYISLNSNDNFLQERIKIAKKLFCVEKKMLIR